jgi:glutaminyl-tRNA synthetase
MSSVAAHIDDSNKLVEVPATRRYSGATAPPFGGARPARSPGAPRSGSAGNAGFICNVSSPAMSIAEATRPLDFIREIVEEDLRSGKHETVITRFPPEPNGYLHIGHAKSICLNFGVAIEYGGHCNLRFDDTNPTKEEVEYAEAIKRDVAWLGFDWGEHLYHASDYFAQLYEWAEELIRKDLAYVDSLTAEQIREYRGTLTEPGKPSPYRSRSIDENLDLFRRMRAGEFEDGAHVLRAKIDVSSPNINMRDPVLYRIRHETHHRTGDAWRIYPLYDYAHPLSDAIEHVTHSLCTLEFEDHRPLYDWLIENLPVPAQPHQYEFARLNLNYTVMSKRKLLRLVEERYVHGWDDPRLPTIAGLRRRGYTPASIRNFADRVGVAKRENVIDVALLEYSVREDLNRTAPRVMGVLRPLRVVITNYPEGRSEEFETPNNPEDPSMGSRRVPFSRVIYIERDDFMEEPPKKFFRLAPGREVRLRSAYFITCTDVVKDADGEIVELRATYDEATRGGDAPDGRRPKATLHWVSAEHAVECEVRLYERLFKSENPEESGNFLDDLNPNSLEVIRDARLEPSVLSSPPLARYQFERLGYFCVDPDSTPQKLVFNRTATLKDAKARIEN